MANRKGTTPSKGKKDKSPSGKKSPPKNKKPAGGPLPDLEKQSQLKKKEELEEEEKFIDDEPTDGPSHFIIISGIYSTAFFNHIDEFSIPIDCLIKFRTQSETLLKKFLSEIDERERLETNLKANLKLNRNLKINKFSFILIVHLSNFWLKFKADPTKNANPTPASVDVAALSEERQAYFNKISVELENFWQNINKVLEKPDDKTLQHVARIKFLLKENPNLKSWFDLEARVKFQL